MKKVSIILACWYFTLGAGLSLHAQSTSNPNSSFRPPDLEPAQADSVFHYPLNTANTHEYVLNQFIIGALMKGHIQGRPLNNRTSAAAFEKYIKALDSGKRFLTTSEIRLLEVFRIDIDDQISSNNLVLLELAEQLMRTQVEKIRAYVQKRVKQPFNLEINRTLELNPEKRAWAKNMDQLYLLWDDILTMDVIRNYLHLEQEAESENQEDAKKDDPLPLQEQAIALTQKKYLSEFGLFSNILKQDRNDQLGRFFNSITATYDPHTRYLPPRETMNFNAKTSGSFYGVGIVIIPNLDGTIKIMEVLPGSPAWKTRKIQIGDTILKVGQGERPPINIEGMRIHDVVAIITGEKGTEVRLTVKHEDGSIETVPIIRDKIARQEIYVRHSILQNKDNEATFGYIEIPSFYREREEQKDSDGNYRSSTADVIAALTQLKELNISGIILDLRHNGGGDIIDAEDISELFVDGPVIQVKHRGGIDVLGADTPAIYHGPLVILVNKFTASASEIVASSTQDYERAIIVGTQTHGKGSVQRQIPFDQKELRQNMHDELELPPQTPMDPMGVLILTIARFYRVTGESVQSFRVTPNFTLPDILSYLDDLGEDHLDFALSGDRIRSLEFRATPYTFDMQELQRKSQERVRQSEKFQKITQEAQWLKAKRENTEYTVSLRSERLRLKDEQETMTQFKSNSIDPNLIISHASVDENLSPEYGQNWKERLQKDPQLGEAMAILNDLINQ